MDEELAALFDEASKLNAKIAAKLRQKKPEPTPVAQSTSPDSEWMTARMFCSTYKVARSTLQRWKEQGRIDVKDLGGRTRRYRCVV